MSGVTGTISQKGVTGSMSQKGVTGSMSQKGITGSISESGYVVPIVPEWTPDTPLGGETPDFWIKPDSRSELTLVDSVDSPANDISILPAHISTYNTSGYGLRSDNGTLDIVGSDFTLCGRFRVLQNTSTGKYLVGKYINGGVTGRYGLNANITTGYFSCYASSSVTHVQINSTINASTCGEAFLLMDVNQATSKVRFFIWTEATGYNQISSDTSFTGTFANLANQYKFLVGAYNAVTTGNPSSFTQMEWSDIRIFTRILTPTEQTTLVNRGSVANPKLYLAGNNKYMLDSSGNGYDLTPVAITNAQIIYSSLGSRQGLDAGYTRHTLYPNKEIQVPYTHTSVPCATVPAGYTKDADIPGDALNHNGADSYLMPVAGTIDRSSTTECTVLSRELNPPFFYLAAFKLGIHAIEATNRNIASFFERDYRTKLFVKRTGRVITDIVKYASNKTGDDYDTGIGWTAEDMNFAFGSERFISMGIYSPYSTSRCLRLCASLLKEGPFYPVAEPTLEDWSYDKVGNAIILPLNANKCNGTIAPVKGEINWIMFYECGDAMLAGISAPIFGSHNGIDWNYICHVPNLPLISGAGSFFVEDDDPTDYTNIHFIGFITATKSITEMHPLNAEFSEWSAAIEIFNPGTPIPYNASIIKLGAVYHMFYSAYNSGANTHYMHHAICTHDPFNASNDWVDSQTGDWSGLGNCESYSFINTGGTNWILYSLELVTGSRYNYALSTDDLASWSAQTQINSLTLPLQVSVDILKLE